MAGKYEIKNFPVNGFMKVFGGTIGGYMISRLITDKVGAKIAEKNLDRKPLYDLAISGAITYGSMFYYHKVDKDKKLLATGAVIGTCLNTGLKFISLPSVKKAMPDSFKSLLSGAADDEMGSRLPTYDQYRQQMEQEILDRTAQNVSAALAASRMHGFEEEMGADEPIYMTPEQMQQIQRQLNGAEAEFVDQQGNTVSGDAQFIDPATGLTVEGYDDLGSEYEMDGYDELGSEDGLDGYDDLGSDGED